MVGADVAYNATICQDLVGPDANDLRPKLWLTSRAMGQRKTQRRVHHIPEWAAKKPLRQADICRELGADKATVSRWFGGVIPSDEYLPGLAALLGAPDVAALFVHPEEHRVLEMLRGSRPEDRERILRALEAAFPKILPAA